MGYSHPLILKEIESARIERRNYYVGGLFFGETITSIFSFKDNICHFYAYIIVTKGDIFVEPINVRDNEGCEDSIYALEDMMRNREGIQKKVLLEIISYYSHSRHL